MSARRTLVTGASRPIGLEIVRQCLERGDKVIAAARSPVKTQALVDFRIKYGMLELLALDPADAASVADAIPILEDITSSIDLLVITPAEAGPHDRAADADRDAAFATLSGTALVEHYRRNAVAPVLLVRTLLPLLKTADRAQVMFVHEDLSTDRRKLPAAEFATAASGAALSTLVQALALELAPYNIEVSGGTWTNG